MEGTEKQVKWANDIKREMIETLEEMRQFTNTIEHKVDGKEPLIQNLVNSRFLRRMPNSIDDIRKVLTGLTEVVSECETATTFINSRDNITNFLMFANIEGTAEYMSFVKRIEETVKASHSRFI